MKKQYWNPASQKWVLIDTSKKGGIISMQETEFEGVPKTEEETPKDVEENKNMDADESSESGWFGW